MTLALAPEVLPETPPKPAWEGADRARHGKLGGSTQRGCMVPQQARARQRQGRAHGVAVPGAGVRRLEVAANMAGEGGGTGEELRLSPKARKGPAEL